VTFPTMLSAFSINSYPVARRNGCDNAVSWCYCHMGLMDKAQSIRQVVWNDFLQMSNSDEDGDVEDMQLVRPIQQSNWQIVFCTSAANHFHVLRRQMLRDFRKPLICFVSKAFLRSPFSATTLQELAEGEFQFVLPDPSLVNADKRKIQGIKKLIFCSGQVFFHLDGFRKKHSITDAAIVRIEQLAPFPFPQVKQQLELFPGAEVVWAQEEPKNMGAWTFASARIKNMMERMGRGRALKYAGRNASGAVSTGYLTVHQQESEQLFRNAFGLSQ